MDIKYYLNKLANKENLSIDESSILLNLLVIDETTPVQVASILSLLSLKGETVEEITGFIKAMRGKVIKVEDIYNSIDVCGTGGDKSNTFNISTAVAFVLSGAGVRVIKHGNRAASSKSGSADVLEELGVNINLNKEIAEKILKEVGMVFLFAPLFNPSFKKVAMVRKEIGIKTIFNYIGPFVNPANVKRQLIGVPNLEIAEKLAKVGKNLNYDHLTIATSTDSLDEISIFAKTNIFEIKGKKCIQKIIDPKEYGFNNNNSLPLLVGKDTKDNADILKRVLNGEKGPALDIVVLNSAYAFVIGGKVDNIKQGITLAKESISSGNAKKVLNNLIKETQKYA